MTETETRTVEQTLRISARPETVWRYWTDPQRMCDWWGAVADLDPRPGGAARVEMEDDGPVMVGEYLELVPHERILMSFGWEPRADVPDMPPHSTRLEVLLTADAGDTILTLRHTGLPPAYAEDHEGGWSHFLAILATVAAEAGGGGGGAP